MLEGSLKLVLTTHIF